MGRKSVELRESVQKTVHVNGTNGGLALDRNDAGPVASGGVPASYTVQIRVQGESIVNLPSYLIDSRLTLLFAPLDLVENRPGSIERRRRQGCGSIRACLVYSSDDDC